MGAGEDSFAIGEAELADEPPASEVGRGAVVLAIAAKPKTIARKEGRSIKLHDIRVETIIRLLVLPFRLLSVFASCTCSVQHFSITSSR
jgi:hypothetical protein